MNGQDWKGRIIFHVDMNSFYASVESNHDSSLVGKPLAIAGNPKERRGIVVTASYEAREYGVKTTMPVWQALKKCPNLIIRPPDFNKYRAVSAELFHFLEEYTDLVEPVSIDEGYMDVTSTFKERNVLNMAEEIQNRLYKELGLPSSIGIAPSKFLAKMASDMKKPLGITVLRKRELSQKLWPLPVEDMHGIGAKTAEKLKMLNIYTIGDLASYSSDSLKGRFGVMGQKLHERANGIDYRDVDPESAKEVKSVGSSTTMSVDIDQKQELLNVIWMLSEKVEARLKQKQVCSANFQITIRYSNRKTITRSKKLLNPLFTKEDIHTQAADLLERYWDGEAVRLLGITGLEVIPITDAYKQLDLFSYKKDIQDANLSDTISELTNKYGKHILKKGHRNNES
ncbi:DNA polymerase IV [Salibacterium salarium]|uniref:DNA polymerase IV n=1 Tax=Salibacterium salarium TaxID=284579 RepID=A0A3R9QRT4_9BACI|nr:DNA polymerase IV [Salibacterium salarium]RSL32011.1 DNA polymerase IV [Salibacterium salarium]